MKRRLRNYPRCRCGKVLCNTLDEARKTHAQIWAERGGEAHVRMYQCPYQSWHWTRMLEPIN